MLLEVLNCTKGWFDVRLNALQSLKHPQPRGAQKGPNNLEETSTSRDRAGDLSAGGKPQAVQGQP